MALVEVGQTAPEFSLTDQHGKRHELADYCGPRGRGRHVVIYFYPRDDTSGCTKEACQFHDAMPQLETRQVAVLGVSPDDEASHAKFAGKYKLPFTLLSDPNRKVMEKYGAYGEKMMYGKKTTGVIRSTVWVGPNGKVVKHWRRVAKAADHPQKVLEALQEQ